MGDHVTSPLFVRLTRWIGILLTRFVWRKEGTFLLISQRRMNLDYSEESGRSIIIILQALAGMSESFDELKCLVGKKKKKKQTLLGK